MSRTGSMLALLIPFVLIAPPARATKITALIGPPTLGQGGANPLSIPPADPVDWQLSYITDKEREYSVSIIPGFFYGQRFTLDQITIGLGAGLLISSNGLGLGVYQSVGWVTKPFWKHYRAEVEYRQVLGYTEAGSEFPYALRIGLSYEL